MKQPFDSSPILLPVRFLEFWWPKSGPDFEDREKTHIASIWATNDLQKMGRYDGRKNAQNLTGSSIIFPINNNLKLEYLCEFYKRTYDRDRDHSSRGDETPGAQ